MHRDDCVQPPAVRDAVAILLTKVAILLPQIVSLRAKLDVIMRERRFAIPCSGRGQRFGEEQNRVSEIFPTQPSAVCGCCFDLRRGTRSRALESWENPTDPTFDGWTIPTSENSGFMAAYSMTTGVTDGHYSLAISPTAANMPPAQQTDPPFTGQGPTYGQMLRGPFSQSNTTVLSHANQVLFDINVPNPNPNIGAFGYLLQFDVVANNADLGYRSLDNFTYSDAALIGGQKTLKFTIPCRCENFAGASTNPTQIIIQVGGGYSYAYTNQSTTPAFESGSLRNVLHR